MGSHAARPGRPLQPAPIARAFFAELYSNPAYQPYDLTASQVLDADDLAPRVNRDPFDALICAAARDLELPLLTRDTAIADSGAVRVWW